MNTDALAKFNTIVHLKAKEMHILKKKWWLPAWSCATSGYIPSPVKVPIGHEYHYVHKYFT